MEKEDGEMSDIESMDIDEVDKKDVKESDFTLIYRPEKEGLLVEALGKTDACKLAERAERFGINLSGKRVITQKQIDDLYTHLGIKDGFERHIRFDAIHLRGVNGLTTKEIFEYFEDFKPVSLEWINNYSCNIVCQDHISAALAILINSREIKDEQIKRIAEVTPPSMWREGFPHPKTDLILVRYATRSDKKDVIPLDSYVNKKIPKDLGYNKEIANDNFLQDEGNKNPWGDLCKSWGVYDHQEVYGPRLPPNYGHQENVQILNPALAKRLGVKKTKYDTNAASLHSKPGGSSSDDDEVEELNIENKSKRIHENISLKRRLGYKSSTKKMHDSDSDTDVEWTKKNKVPRMRMHADDEVEKLKKKNKSGVNPKNTTSIYVEVMNTDKRPKVHTRLGNVVQPLQNSEIDVRSRLGTRVSKSICSIHSESDVSEESLSSLEDINVMSRVQKVNSMSTKLASSVWSRLSHHPKDRLTLRSKKDGADLRTSLNSKENFKNDLKISHEGDLRSRLYKNKRKSQSPLKIEIDNEYYGK